MAHDLHTVDRSNNIRGHGRKFYTEDNILIYTLYISNIPETFSSDELKKYFDHFGKVETLTYKKKYKTAEGHRYRAIVKFLKSESASKTLRVRNHKVGNVVLEVRGADSWIQPHKKRLKPLLKIDDNDTENFFILKLNDYCLFNIFSYLPFQDQVRMSILSDRFKKIFLLIYKNERHLKLNEENTSRMSLLEIYESVTTIGKFIETLEVDCRIRKFNRIYDFIFKYFPHLKILHLENLNKKYCNSNKEISLSLKNITHLTIRNCNVTDEQAKKFVKLQKLEYLDLSDNEELVGKYLHNLKKLNYLCLNNCEKIETSNLKPILEKIPLKTLKVTGIRNADAIGSPFSNFVNLELEEFHLTSYRPENTFLKKIPTFKNLKKIRLQLMQLEKDDIGLKDFLLSCVENKANVLEYLGLVSQHLQLSELNIDTIIQLKNLKELEINRLTNADCLFWTKLCSLEKLEFLNVYCDQENFDENEFLSWIKKSKNIQKIRGKFGKKNIKIDFINSLIEISKELAENNRKIKFEIIGLLIKEGDDTNVNILTDTKYLTNRHIIRVILSDTILEDDSNLNK
ncbi:uncharacterized protein LOC129606868 [Condylostylus longicornis]|uniref:uncharacterized protein LOC129606868 n=1 Tax=Condylostylus longicornis TaxID=2530218 RepID=UPI00244E5AA7|nr:uncharacterized protein LOC129606868 [Condylostylus longicornis]